MFNQSEWIMLSQRVSIFNADKIKISTLNLYYNDWNKLKAYLIQIKLYIKWYSSQFKFIENKVFFAFIYLKDNAFTWFHHYLTNYLQKKLKKQEEKINMIFHDFQIFKKCLRKVFENIDKNVQQNDNCTICDRKSLQQLIQSTFSIL